MTTQKTPATTRPAAATVKTMWSDGRTYYQARCARGHTSGWLLSEVQARLWLWDWACDACKHGFE